MNITYSAWGFVIATTLLASGCSKKEDGPAGATSSKTTTTTGPAPTGIKGTFKGKPFEAKVAWFELNATDKGLASLHLKSVDAKCKFEELNFEKNGSMQVEVLALPKKGLTKFDGDNAFANMGWQTGNAQSTTDTSNGEIEWFTLPTETTKGLVRVKVTKDPDTKVEGIMEAAFCKK